MSGSVIKTFADERLLASDLGVFFPQAIARETLLFSRHIQAPDEKISPRLLNYPGKNRLSFPR